MIFCGVPQAPSCIHSLVFMTSFKLSSHVTTLVELVVDANSAQSSFDMNDVTMLGHVTNKLESRLLRLITLGREVN